MEFVHRLVDYRIITSDQTDRFSVNFLIVCRLYSHKT